MHGPSKAEVWRINLSGAVGHEQKDERPAIMWRDLDHLGMAIMIPFTSVLEAGKMIHTCHVSPSLKNGLEKESVALVFQIRALDKERLVKKLGVLNEADISAIGTTLKELLRV